MPRHALPQHDPPAQVKTYLKAIALSAPGPASSGRTAQPFDAEFGLEEKAGAHCHYMDTLQRRVGFGGRLEQLAQGGKGQGAGGSGGGGGQQRGSRPLKQRLIVVLNREGASNGRVMGNAKELHRALVASDRPFALVLTRLCGGVWHAHSGQSR